MNERWLQEPTAPLHWRLHPQSAKRFDAIFQRYQTVSNKNNPAFRYTSLEPQSFSGRERLLGFEVLVYGGHSYLCSGLKQDLFEKFRGTLTKDGLIADGDVAERFAEYMSKHDLGEPGLKLSYAFFEYL